MRNAWENEKANSAAVRADRTLDLTTGLAAHLKSFRRDEEGAVGFILSLGILVSIMVVGGLGIDFMRHERERVRMQNTLDRAVLAAADLDQELDPASVVADYFAKADVKGSVTGANVDSGLNYRTVSAQASGPLDPIVMAYPLPDVQATSEAEERINKVEISMVLDISGSMASGSKIGNLRQAGKTFVDTVIGSGTGGQVSVSLVPYSEHVNAGPDILRHMNYNYKHNYSHCLEIPNADFSQTVFDTTATYDQMQHFQWNYDGYNNYVRDTVCPQYDYERIRPLSQDTTILKNQINSLQPRAGTAIYLGMKWGVGLLDPSMQGVVSDLVSDGVVDSAFSTRPAAYTDPDTLKTVILMTDGINSSSRRIASHYYRTNYNHHVHWAKYNFNWYLSHYVNYYDRPNWSYKSMNTTTANNLLDNICDAAKAKGIVIWSIGFEVNDTGAGIMQQCASSPAHFFRVEGVEITEAFRTIARQLNQLRLTQ